MYVMSDVVKAPLCAIIVFVFIFFDSMMVIFKLLHVVFNKLRRQKQEAHAGKSQSLLSNPVG